MFEPGQLTQVSGAMISGYGGYKSEKAKRKAAKARNAGLINALNQFKRGSTDAQGNTLSADGSGRWKYNLSNAGNAAKSMANKELYNAQGVMNKSRSQLLRDNLANTQLANNLTARANQNAAMRSGMRTASNLGSLNQANVANNSYNLRNNFLNASKMAKDNANYNANMRNNAYSVANNAQQPIQNIQSNLQGMISNLNAPVMGQMNRIAAGMGDPYVHGMSKAKTIQGIGGMVSGIGQNMQDTAHMDELMGMLTGNNGNGPATAEQMSIISKLIPLFMGA